MTAAKAKKNTWTPEESARLLTLRNANPTQKWKGFLKANPFSNRSYFSVISHYRTLTHPPEPRTGQRKHARKRRANAEKSSPGSVTKPKARSNTGRVRGSGLAKARGESSSNIGCESESEDENSDDDDDDENYDGSKLEHGAKHTRPPGLRQRPVQRRMTPPPTLPEKRKCRRRAANAIEETSPSDDSKSDTIPLTWITSFLNEGYKRAYNPWGSMDRAEREIAALQAENSGMKSRLDILESYFHEVVVERNTQDATLQAQGQEITLLKKQIEDIAGVGGWL